MTRLRCPKNHNVFISIMNQWIQMMYWNSETAVQIFKENPQLFFFYNTCKYVVFIFSHFAFVTLTCKLMQFVYIDKCPSCTLSELRIELKLKMISTNEIENDFNENLLYFSSNSISYTCIYNVYIRWHMLFKIWLRLIHKKNIINQY